MSSKLDLVSDFDSMELVEIGKNTVTLKFTGVVSSKKDGNLKTIKDEVEVEVRKETYQKINKEIFGG